jgi:ribosomal protein S7
MAMKWIILAAKDKDPKVHFPEKLAWELVDAAANQVCSHCQLLSHIFQDI